MDWKMHLLIPLFLYIAVVLILQFPLAYSVQALFLLLFSSFLPDIDHPKSVMRKVTGSVVPGAVRSGGVGAGSSGGTATEWYRRQQGCRSFYCVVRRR